MAFIPQSDWIYRSKRSCGIDGHDAVERTRAELRHKALTGQEMKPVPLYLTRPDRFVNDHHASIFSNNHSLLGYTADKPTHDFPNGGKHVGQQRRQFAPSPIITPEVITTISGSVRRMGAIDIPTEKLRTIWSEGREAAKRRYAEQTAATPSPIHFNNPLTQLEPLRSGTRAIEGRSDRNLDERLPKSVSVMGFAGMGNRNDNAQKRTGGDKSNAVPFGSLPFLGERKPLYAGESRK
jgi:hypothetical protein